MVRNIDDLFAAGAQTLRTNLTTNALRVCIHRGSKEIGGNCVELEASGMRLVIDVGRPLDAPVGYRLDAAGITGMPNPTLLGVLLSHPHQDHYGLAEQLDESVKIYVGKAAAAILEAAAFFTPSGVRLRPAGFLVDRRPLTMGPFVITPYLVDHSAFDSYALLVEAAGRRLFYSGDFRAHGRKASLVNRLRRHVPANVDVLMLEGTHVRADGAAAAGDAESDVELAMADIFRQAEGVVNVFSSAQNIDRLVTIYRACKRTGRTLVVDLYTATIAGATGITTIPQPGFPNLRVYVPNRQRILVKESRQFDRVEAIRPQRILLEEIQTNRNRFVIMLQGSSLAEIARAGCLEGAAAIWSLWSGYLERRSGARVARLLENYAVPITHIHASGHAPIEELQMLATAFASARVVPIHSSAPSRFADLFDNVEQHSDGEWWTV